MAANLFKTAVKLAPAPAAAKPSNKLEVPLDGLETLAQVDALMKALSAVKETLDAELKDTAFDKFMTLASNGVRPASFRGIEGIASASIEMRKRSSASVLKPDEVTLMTTHNVPYFRKIKTNHMFGINPKFAADEKLLAKVSKALEKIVPEDFIVEQEEVVDFVVDDSTMAAAFKEGVPEEVIRICTTLAIKPKLETTDIAAIMDSVKSLLTAGDPLEAVIAAAPAAAPVKQLKKSAKA